MKTLIFVTALISLNAFAEPVYLVISQRGMSFDAREIVEMKREALGGAVRQAFYECTHRFGGQFGASNEDSASNVCVVDENENFMSSVEEARGGVKKVSVEIKTYCRVDEDKATLITRRAQKGDGTPFRDCRKRVSAQQYLN